MTNTQLLAGFISNTRDIGFAEFGWMILRRRELLENLAERDVAEQREYDELCERIAETIENGCKYVEFPQ